MADFMRQYVEPFLGEINIALAVFVGLSLFLVLFCTVKWIQFRFADRKLTGELMDRAKEITFKDVESVSLMKLSDKREYIFRIKMKDEEGS